MSTNKKGAQCLRGPFWVFETACSTLENTTLVHLLCDKKGSQPWVRTIAEKSVAHPGSDTSS